MKTPDSACFKRASNLWFARRPLRDNLLEWRIELTGGALQSGRVLYEYRPGGALHEITELGCETHAVDSSLKVYQKSANPSLPILVLHRGHFVGHHHYR